MAAQERCIFCAIVAGDEPASIVHEDAHTVAFMNIRQANPGHVLVIPRRHVAQIFDLDAELAGHLGRTITQVAGAIRAAFGVSGLNLWQSNGEIAGQEIFHVHFHLFPRRRGDGWFQVYPADRPLPHPQSRAYLESLAEQVRAEMKR